MEFMLLVGATFIELPSSPAAAAAILPVQWKAKTVYTYVCVRVCVCGRAAGKDE